MARLGELLVQAGAITSEQLTLALRDQRRRGGRLGTHLVELGFLSESALARTLSAQLRLPAVSAAALERIPPDVLSLISRDTAAHYRAVPVRVDGGHLWVAMSDPTDARALAELEAATRRTVRPMVAPDLLVSFALERHYGVAHFRRTDASVSAKLDLPIEAGDTGSGARGLPGPPTPFDDPYSPSERARIEARAIELDAVGPETARPTPTAGRRRTTLPRVGAVGTTALSVVSAKVPSPQGRIGPTSLGARLVAATSQREAFEAILSFLGQDFQRSAVFVQRNARLAGFLASGPGVDENALHDWNLATAEIPVLAKILTDGKPRLGRASAATLGAVTRVLGPPGDFPVLLLPVRSGGDAVACIIATGGVSGVETYAEEYLLVAKKLDWALQMLRLRKKLLEA